MARRVILTKKKDDVIDVANANNMNIYVAADNYKGCTNNELWFLTGCEDCYFWIPLSHANSIQSQIGKSKYMKFKDALQDVVARQCEVTELDSLEELADWIKAKVKG